MPKLNKYGTGNRGMGFDCYTYRLYQHCKIIGTSAVFPNHTPSVTDDILNEITREKFKKTLF